MKSVPFLLSLVLCAGAAQSQTGAPPPLGVASLMASASAELPRDWMSLTLGATREGREPGAVQAALRTVLEEALAEAKKAVRPGQLEVQTGNFAVQPRYSKDGVIASWQGSAELVIEGRDAAALGTLAARAPGMTVARVAYRLSREQRERAESEVAAQAIARFRARAAEVARHFGYAGYRVREVNVSSSEPPPFVPVAALRARAAGVSDEALPLEPGKGLVTVTVSGSVQME